MDDHTISLVRESYDLIEPISQQAGLLFYDNLFEADPSLRALFKGDMQQQAAHLMRMFAMAVSTLDRPEVLMPALDELGKRHAGYKVRDEYYDTVGQALLKTLYQGLGVAYTPEIEEAWIEVYGVMSARMKSAARLQQEVASA